MKHVLMIKRYANRKLYNTETAQYVTLSFIVECIKLGRSVFVIDNVSKYDITKECLISYLNENPSEVCLNEIFALIHRK